MNNDFPSQIRIGNDTYKTADDAYFDQKLKVEQTANKNMNWQAIRKQIMYTVIDHKFKQCDNLRDRLLATGDRELINANNNNDQFFGVYRGRGSNHLGKILMQVRDELRDPSSATKQTFVVEIKKNLQYQIRNRSRHLR